MSEPLIPVEKTHDWPTHLETIAALAQLMKDEAHRAGARETIGLRADLSEILSIVDRAKIELRRLTGGYRPSERTMATLAQIAPAGFTAAEPALHLNAPPPNKTGGLRRVPPAVLYSSLVSEIARAIKVEHLHELNDRYKLTRIHQGEDDYFTPEQRAQLSRSFWTRVVVLEKALNAGAELFPRPDTLPPELAEVAALSGSTPPATAPATSPKSTQGAPGRRKRPKRR